MPEPRPAAAPVEAWQVYLFVPADRPERFLRAATSGADAVIVDFEDALDPAHLEEARAAAVPRLGEVQAAGCGCVVRVHDARHAELAADVAAVVGPWLDAVVLPKADRPEDVEAVDALLTEAERQAGLAAGSVAVLPLVESCLGLRHTFDIASASPRVRAMVFSGGEEGDFMADLGGRWTPDGAALAYPRSRFVCEVRAVGGVPAIDGVCMTLGDPEVLESECRIGRTLGFDGKTAIHPDQVHAIRDAFSPTAEELAQAARLVAALDAAAGGSSVIRFEGKMVDPANARLARRALARARERA